MRSLFDRILPAALLGFLASSLAAAPTATNSAGLDFFEGKIRPVLVDNCYKCHSRQSPKIRGGLMLDTREALRKGGDSGPALAPGHPERSLIIKAVSYTDPDLQMPPKDHKLPDDQIADLKLWIKMGAPDPRSEGAESAVAPDIIAARKHWAFQPVVEPALPKIHRHKNWIKTPVDAFVLANLNAKRLTPSPPADKRILIRRATFDLTGVPPTAEEVQAFVADKSKDAFAKVVDRLLASPHYGERWGRYWLDVARYADTKGPAIGQINTVMPYAYTYRDYVVRSFNDDLPYNQFILEQLAADQLPSKPDDNRSLAAMGFLTVGRHFFGNQNDVIDDRIDVVCRGLLGLTVTCARCHDHKFDPIPTRDYYSLHGIFNSSLDATNLPLLTLPRPARYAQFLEDIRTNQAVLDAYATSNETAALNRLRASTGDYLLAVTETTSIVSNATKLADYLRARQLNKYVFERWSVKLPRLEKTNAALFQPWGRFANAAPAQRAGIAASFATNESIDPLVARMFNPPPTNLTVLAESYDRLFGNVASNTIDSDGAEEIRQFFDDPHSPANPDRSEFSRQFLYDQAVINKLKTLKNKITEVEATDPGAPPRAMVLEDKKFPGNSRIFLRGNPNTPGAEAPRGFIQVINIPNAPVFPKRTSGRLQLAEDIASPENPLTARVFINRVWAHHFGAPLVASEDDFGVRTIRPLQGDLLDYLSARFMADGWSLKKLHRLIMLSAVYQQSSEDDPKIAKIDPDNDCLWRMNPRRLDFEAMRDSVLAVAGDLDETVGGQPVDVTTNTLPASRTIYARIDRDNLPGYFRTFDFANPDVTSAGRFETIVAPQALYLLNSPLFAQCAAGVLAHCEANNDETQIRRIYERLFQREPTPNEITLGENYIASQPSRDAVVPEPADWEYGWGNFDEQTHGLQSFTEFPVFNGYAWKTRGTKAEGNLGPAQIYATGGVTGRTNIAAVRRWIAPRDGEISIKGALMHAGTKSSGVQAWIVSSRLGLIGQAVARNGTNDIALEKVEVRAGDTIDFIVENPPKGYPSAFKWAPVIEMAKAGPDEMGLPHLWDAKGNFVDPKKVKQPLGPWEKYAEVLLFSNEFFFVD